MKILILIFSAFLIFSYGCGGSDEEDSTETETQAGDTDPNNNDDDVVPSPRVPPIPIGPATPGAQDPCARYTASCGTDLKLCSDKYVHCLKPKAGEPATKKTVTCTKQSSKNITMIVNEWNHQPGTNNLLCEFFEDNILYWYATNSKNDCKNEMNKRKDEIDKFGYKCN